VPQHVDSTAIEDAVDSGFAARLIPHEWSQGGTASLLTVALLTYLVALGDGVL
jgi:hypothetical protein